MATESLRDSFQTCVDLARRTGKNFYYSFLTLPRSLADDMCVLYAFMRWTDDLADADELPPELREIAIDHWRQHVTAALEQAPSGQTARPSVIQKAFDPLSTESGRQIDMQILSALSDVVQRHSIPHQYLFDVIKGVESDLRAPRMQTFSDLERYCYHVAGAVGLCCIHLWGFEDPRAENMAIDCGTAFQLTNILRDLGEDAQRGRVYLPQEDLDRFGYRTEDLKCGRRSDEFRELMRFQVDRATAYYDHSAGLREFLNPAGRRIYSAMRGIYGGLLREIERREFDVFSHRIRLSGIQKLKSAVMAYWRH